MRNDWMEADIASQSLGLASNTDFSLISLFLRADIIVKSVIIILIASSIYSCLLYTSDAADE